MTLSELSGLYSGLSGDLQDLEDRVLDIEGKIVAFPTSDDFDTLSALTTSRFNTLQSSINSLTSKLATLEVYVVNLKLSHTSLERSFTGHTGVAFTGNFGYWGSFWDTGTQTNAGVNSGNIMLIRSTDPESNGISIVDNSKITFQNSGVYNIQFSAQFDKTDAGDDATEIWFVKNGIPLSDSNTSIMLHGNNSKEVAAWNYMLPLNSGDYIQIVWHSNDTDMRLLYQTSGTNPTRPAIPSVIVTAHQVRFEA